MKKVQNSTNTPTRNAPSFVHNDDMDSLMNEYANQKPYKALLGVTLTAFAYRDLIGCYIL